MRSVVLPLKKSLVGYVDTGAASCEFTGADLGVQGYSIGLINVVCSGLDGGTFALEGLCADGTWRSLSTSTWAEDEIAVLEDKYILDGIRVQMTGLGAGAAPVAYLSAFGHNAKHTIYQ